MSRKKEFILDVWDEVKVIFRINVIFIIFEINEIFY